MNSAERAYHRPNQKFSVRPSFCITLIHCPAREPATTISRAINNTLTPSFCPLGSLPDKAGAKYKPVASHDVAIQNVAN